jgi:hypothetical protein
MSHLLDRLCGYEVDDSAGKTKLPIHQFVDALEANRRGWNGAPTDAEINTAFGLVGQSFDPGNTQLADAQAIVAVVVAGTRTIGQIQAALRLGERYRSTITKLRVAQMMTLA